MNYQKLKELSEVNTKQFIGEASTSSLDFTLPDFRFSDVLYRLYTRPLVSSFGSILPITKPAGLTFGLTREYDITPPVNVELKKDFANVAETANLNQVKFKLKSKPVSLKTKKLKSNWSVEALQDYRSLFTNKSQEELNEIISNELTNEMVLELDNEAFDFMKSIAKKVNVTLTTNIGTLYSYELIGIIARQALEIEKFTHSRHKIVVFCSNKVASLLMSHPSFVYPNKNMNLTQSIYYQGDIGNIEIYTDIYNFNNSQDDFVLVGVKDPSEGINSSIIYMPYNISMWVEPSNYESSELRFYSAFRYGLSQVAFDEDGQDKSKMLSFVTIKIQ